MRYGFKLQIPWLYYMVKTVLSEEVRSILAVVSLGLVIGGVLKYMIYLAPPAVICAVLALYTAPGEKVIGTTYKICAFISLAVGILEIVAEILILTGIVVIPS